MHPVHVQDCTVSKRRLETANLKHAGNGSSVFGDDKEEQSTGFLHGDLLRYEALVPTVLQLRVVERHAVCAATISLPVQFICTITHPVSLDDMEPAIITSHDKHSVLCHFIHIIGLARTM